MRPRGHTCCSCFPSGILLGTTHCQGCGLTQSLTASLPVKHLGSVSTDFCALGTGRKACQCSAFMHRRTVFWVDIRAHWLRPANLVAQRLSFSVSPARSPTCLPVLTAHTSRIRPAVQHRQSDLDAQRALPSCGSA